MNEQEWRSQLEAYIKACRASVAVPEDLTHDALAHYMYRIAGGFMRTWLNEYGPRMLAERDMLRPNLSANPVIVIHGDMPLLVACRVLLRDPALQGEGGVVAMLSTEYEDFVRQHPEAEEFDYHVSTWSRFEPAAESLLERAREQGHAIESAGAYYDHVNGTLWGEMCGLEVHNLWQWNGEKLSLIEEAIEHVRF